MRLEVVGLLIKALMELQVVTKLAHLLAVLVRAEPRFKLRAQLEVQVVLA
jgi:hypothetical protein